MWRQASPTWLNFKTNYFLLLASASNQSTHLEISLSNCEFKNLSKRQDKIFGDRNDKPGKRFLKVLLLPGFYSRKGGLIAYSKSQIFLCVFDKGAKPNSYYFRFHDKYQTF